MDSDNILKNILISTPVWVVLDFLLQNPEFELIDAEIAEKVWDTVQKSAVNLALRKLGDAGIIKRQRRGRMVFNRLIDTPIVRELKVASNLMRIRPLKEKLIAHCSKIVLFGSRAEGMHKSDSDFDLFTITTDGSSVEKIVGKSELSEIVQLVWRKPEDMLTFEKDEPVLNDEIRKGIVLWERT